MSMKFLRRAAIAGVFVLAASTWSTSAVAGAFAEESPAATAPPAASDASETAAPETEAPESAAPETEAPESEAPAEAPAAESSTSSDAAEPEALEAAEPAPEIVVSIPEVDLDGPAIAEVEVTVSNDSSEKMSSVVVSFAGPVGWQVVPSSQKVDAIKPGRDQTATFQMRVPEKRPGFALRVFTSTVTYKGGDGAGSATGIRAMPTTPPTDSLAALFNNVAITALSQTTAGNFDGEGNTFSAEQLAAVGAAPGAQLEALGATLTMPSSQPGTADNVTAAGQALRIGAQGQRLVFLGSGSSLNATGTATVFYTDGTTSSGAIGFPNWSFHDENAHGAELAVSTNGRNRPNGYGDAAYQYRMFAHSVPLTAGKTVDFVVLPTNSSMHIFSIAVAP
ncbi:NEW3 domain-containing protein [Agromyces cerinus]|uniref:NPCBM-associated, NEW3 domain of alpha-galactosidase n=1 Tax=Agromyces cerinus subsp. cerinus TaxID=232089 RepID=A0A1N6IA96_9MICO|nr:NEW3 domain-containing protein [Agromyces cerinus]SIO28947.1 NPCBM-associated, NEW3 domain of alpha-galactosidase [Agromyces cerinus subsp. cerinus]